MSTTTWIGLLGMAVVLAVTPGPDTLLALRYAVVGRRHGVMAASGTSVAIFVWAGLAAVGVAAVLNSSPAAYAALATVGGAYLLVLGVRTLGSARARLREDAPATTLVHAGGAGAAESGAAESGTAELGAAVAGAAVGGAFLAGIATCLTNPKTGLFFIALFPQFVTPGVGSLYVTLVLGGTVAIVLYAYLVGVVAIADAARLWLARPRVTATIEAVSGAILAALGVYMTIDAVPGLPFEAVGRWLS